MPNNELKCPVPESRFNTMNSDLFEKIDYDKAAALTNNSNVDAGSAEQVDDADHGTEAGTEAGDIRKDTTSEDTPSEDNASNGEQEEPNNT